MMLNSKENGLRIFAVADILRGKVETALIEEVLNHLSNTVPDYFSTDPALWTKQAA